MERRRNVQLNRRRFDRSCRVAARPGRRNAPDRRWSSTAAWLTWPTPRRLPAILRLGCGARMRPAIVCDPARVSRGIRLPAGTCQVAPPAGALSVPRAAVETGAGAVARLAAAVVVVVASATRARLAVATCVAAIAPRCPAPRCPAVPRCPAASLRPLRGLRAPGRRGDHPAPIRGAASLRAARTTGGFDNARPNRNLTRTTKPAVRDALRRRGSRRADFRRDIRGRPHTPSRGPPKSRRRTMTSRRDSRPRVPACSPAAMPHAGTRCSVRRRHPPMPS